MTRMTIDDFAGELVQPGDPTFDTHRGAWNAIVDRRLALIARCTSAADVAAAIRFARTNDLEIAVKCGGHGILGLAVPSIAARKPSGSRPRPATSRTPVSAG